MLWREPYQTRISYDAAVPELRGEYLGGSGFDPQFPLLIAMIFEPGELPRLEVVRRLSEAELPIPYWLGMFADAQLIADALPPTVHRRVLTLDLMPEWRDLAQNAPVLSAVMDRQKHAAVLLEGPLTEDAWDAVLEACC